MKRLIIIFSVVSSMLFFTTFYTELAKYKELQTYNGAYHEMLKEGYELTKVVVNVKEQEELQVVIQTFLNTVDDEVYGSFSIYDRDTKERVQYISHERLYESYLSEVTWEELQGNCISDEIESSLCLGRIEQARKVAPELEERLVIKDANQLRSVEINENYGYGIDLFSKNSQASAASMTNLLMNKGIDAFANTNYREQYRNNVFDATKKVGFILFFIYILLFIVWLLQMKQEIAVYKMHGYPHHKIMIKQYARTMLLTLLFFIGGQVVLLFIYEQAFTKFTSFYLSYLPCIIGICGFAILVCFGCLYGLISKIYVVKNLKDRNMNGMVSNLIFGLKVLLFVIFIPSIVVVAQEFTVQWEAYQAFQKVGFMNDYFFYDSSDVAHEDMISFSNEMFELINEHEGLYFTSGAIIKDYITLESEYYLIMNHQAAQLFFSEMSLDSTKNYLIEHSVQSASDELKALYQNSKNPFESIKVDEVYKIPSLLPLWIDEKPTYIVESVPILVITSLEEVPFGTPRFPEYLLPNQQETMLVETLGNDKAFKNANIVYSRSLYESRTNYLESSILYFMMMFIILTLLLGLMVYTTIFITFEKNKQCYIIEALHGYSIYKTYHRLFYIVLFEVVAISLLFIVVLQLPWLITSMIMLVLCGSELLLTIYFIMYFRKKSLIAMSKGELLC